MCMGVFYFTTIYLFQKFSAPFWHHSHPFSLISGQKKGFREISETLKITVLNNNYSMIVATAPEPTVLPPSRIFKKRFIVKVPIYLDLLYKYHLILFVLFHLFIFMVPY